MRRIMTMGLLLLAMSLSQSCNDASTDPLTDDKGNGQAQAAVRGHLQNNAWITIKETGLAGEPDIGLVIRFFPDGTYWESSEGDEATWQLSSDGKTVTLPGPGSKSFTIVMASKDSLVIEGKTSGGQKVTLYMVPDPSFTQTRYLLTRTTWRHIRSGLTSDTVDYHLGYHGQLYMFTGKMQKNISSGYALTANETVLRFDPSVMSSDQKILGLTRSTLKIKDQASGEEITLSAKW